MLPRISIQNYKLTNNLKNKTLSALKTKKILIAAWACEDKYFASYQQWYTPFNKIFGKVILFDPKKHKSIYGKNKMNELLLEKIKTEKPDFVFFWLISDEFSINTILKIKEISPNTRTINFFGDDDERFENYTRYLAKIFDYGLIHPQLLMDVYKKENLNNVFLTCGINTDNFKAINIEKKYDVTFVGTPKKDRYDFIKYLIEKGIKVNIFGAGWSKYPDLKKVYGGQLSSENLVKVINQSKINLCFSQNYQKGPHLKGRIFEVCGCKSFILCEYAPIVKDFFKQDREIVFFKDNKDLLNKVRYYLNSNDKRNKIAENAYNSVIKNYNVLSELILFFSKILYDKNFYAEELKTSKKVFLFKEEYFNLSLANIKKIVFNYDYIHFASKHSHSSPYKELIQAYSLEVSHKDLSCCDYYINSPGLGNYLLFQSVQASRSLREGEFSKFININQIMATKQFFLDNYLSFNKIYNGDTAYLINKKNTAFIQIPLAEVNEFKKEWTEASINLAFRMNFLEDLSVIIYQKKIFSPYPYKLLLKSILGKSFIIHHLYKNNIKNAHYLNRLRKIFFKSVEYYDKI